MDEQCRIVFGVVSKKLPLADFSLPMETVLPSFLFAFL